MRFDFEFPWRDGSPAVVPIGYQHAPSGNAAVFDVVTCDDREVRLAVLGGVTSLGQPLDPGLSSLSVVA